MGMAGIGGLRHKPPFDPGCQSLAFHQFRYGILADLHTLLVELSRDPRRAVSAAAAVMHLGDLCDPLHLLLLSWTRLAAALAPGVIARASHFQHPAHLAHRPIPFRFHFTLLDPSEDH